MQEIKNLLSQTFSISRQFEKIAEVTGENFNIFKVLKLTTNEVKTHSAFLAELLNPKGSHGQKEVFLNLFCEELKITDFDCGNALVEIEKDIGFISNKYENGGSIDIVISSNSKAIIIENKIYARDQKNQLKRYYNFGTNKYRASDLFYLTLDGKDASDVSKGGLTEGYKLISYSKEILKWLEKCKEKSVNHAILRETITQYINLIKYLTGQNNNNEMKNEIINIITSDGNNMAASIEIANSIDEAKRKLLLKFAKNIEIKMQEINPQIKIKISGNIGDKWSGIEFFLPSIETEYIMLAFATKMSNIYFEIVNENNGRGENKKASNIEFYKNSLNNSVGNWGKVDDVINGWHGDWVCYYEKLNRIINENKFWSIIADGNDNILIDDLVQDVKKLLDVLKDKIQTIKNP